MNKEFKILLIDDKPDDITPIMDAVKILLKRNVGYNISFKVISRQKEIDEIDVFPVDVIMFDCALSAAMIDFGDEDVSLYGFELIKRFRGKNKRTKVIFYSGSFDLTDNDSFRFTALEYIEMINELNIFKITGRSIEAFFIALKDAIAEIDTILVGMDDLLSNYGEQGVFSIGEKTLKADQLIQELKLGTQLGEIFRKEVNELILVYLMKFGNEVEQ